MRSVFLVFFVISSFYSGVLGKNKKSNGLIFDFVESNSNFSVDPCTDFAAHMCPEGGKNFRDVVENQYNNIWKFQEYNNHSLKHILTGKNQKMKEITILVEHLSNGSTGMRKICSSTPSMKAASYNIAKIFDERKQPKIHLNSTCEEIGKFLNGSFDKALLISAYNTIIRGAIGIAVHEHIEKKTSRFHQLYSDLKAEFSQRLKATPWARHKNVTDKFFSKLDSVTINDFGTLVKPLEKAISEFDKNYESCVKTEQNMTEDHKVFCKFSAVQIATEIIAENPYFHYEFFKESAGDSIGNIYNYNDGTIFFGNHAELLVYSDMVPAFYGLLGFLMGHELMHTFTFDEKDDSNLKDLWTNETQCITQQTVKTCQNYNVPCGDSKQTFEEDAADFNGIRLAWQVYQKNKRAIREKTGRFALQRKKVLQNAFEINDDQLFFYAAGVFLCDGEHRSSSTAEQLKKSDHSLAYIRINNIASQMDQFHQAFNCKKDDLIVKNKVSTCVQYGNEAPQRKSASAPRMKNFYWNGV